MAKGFLPVQLLLLVTVRAFLTNVYSHRNPSLVQKYSPKSSGPDPATKPDYESLSGPFGKPLDDLFLRIFRDKLAEQVLPGQQRNETASFDDIVQLVHHLVKTSPSPEHIQNTSHAVLKSMFPSWLPPQFTILFSRPFPQFAAQMNAVVTAVASTWLMGPSTVVQNSNAAVVQVERCRFLEEAGCISVCVNACQIPTQNFFRHDMGLFLTMEPDYETFGCQFSFGVKPPEDGPALAPCLTQCPSAGAYRHGNSKRADDERLKKLIREGMANSS